MSYRGDYVECLVISKIESVVIPIDRSKFVEDELPENWYAYRFGNGTIKDGRIKVTKKTENFFYRGEIFSYEEMKEKYPDHPVIKDMENSTCSHAMCFQGFWKAIKL